MVRDVAASGAVTVQLLAEHPDAIAAVAEICWREWGQPPEPTDLAWWVAATTREAGRDALPISWVALDAKGVALGRVGLIAYDWHDWPERTPWVAGMIVRPDHRGHGLGGRLMAQLEAWARDQGHTQVWVATGGRAIAFYRKCGWEVIEIVPHDSGEMATILSKRL